MLPGRLRIFIGFVLAAFGVNTFAAVDGGTGEPIANEALGLLNWVSSWWPL